MRKMAADFEIMFCCFIVVFFTVIIYLAGKADFLTLVPQILLDRLEEINRKHGEWIEKQIHLTWCEDDVDIVFECSVCKTEVPFASDYCPNCGAKMERKDDT